VNKFLLYITLFVFNVVYLYAQQDTLVPKIFYFGDGSVSSQGFFYNNQPEGYWKAFYPGGQIKSEGNRVKHLLDGVWIFYNSNGDTSELITFRNGIKNGYYQVYDNNRLIKKEVFLDGIISGLSYEFDTVGYLEIPHKLGLKHGLALYYIDSNVVKIVDFRNGYKVSERKINQFAFNRKQGPWINFHPNRKIFEEKNFYLDTLDGFYRMYDINGNLLKNLFYNKGILDTNSKHDISSVLNQSFYEDGKIKTEGYFENGKPIGMHKSFAHDDDLITGTLYDAESNILGIGLLDIKGRRQGKWTFYNPESVIISIGYFKEDIRTKEWVFYFDNGNIEQQGHYKQGKPNGEWKTYYENAKLFKVENYEKGILSGKFFQYSDKEEIFCEGYYSENELDKEWIWHFTNITINQFYQSGQKDGKWFSTYTNGKVAFKGSYISNEANGVHYYYYENGMLKQQEQFESGVKVKYWISYDNEGLETIRYYYQNDKMVSINGIKFDE